MKLRNVLPVLGIAWLASALLPACKKEATTGPYTPPVAQVNPLQQVFVNNLAQAVQYFSINTDNGPAYVHGAAGLSASFAQHAFRKADGTTATGTIDIALVEALKVGKMLWLNKQTVGLDNGQPKLLVSGGQFQLTASQGGEALALAPGMSYLFVPTNNPDPNMSVFSGTPQADGTMLWNPWSANPIDTTVQDTTTQDSTGTGNSWYSFPNDSLGWINCDYFYNSPGPLTGLQVTCPAGYDNTNTYVWVVFPYLNSMTNLYSSSGSMFSSSGGYEMPEGINITVVALADVDGQYYSSFSNAVVSAGMNLNIAMQPTTLAQFQADAGAL